MYNCLCFGAAQTFWDGFDPKAQSFREWAPAFYDEALAAAEAEIRWLAGLLPDQVGVPWAASRPEMVQTKTCALGFCDGLRGACKVETA